MKLTLRLFLFIGLLSACDSGAHEENMKNTELESTQEETLEDVNDIPIRQDTSVLFENNAWTCEVMIQYPKESPVKGTIMALQGWDFPNTDWCENSQLCDEALDRGYVLIFPDMGKSIYHWRNYPETRKDWLKYPTRNWLEDTLIANLQKEFKLLLPSSENYVLGLSTGARGAFFLGKEMPEIFDAVACLSGDYDQKDYPNDNLYKGYFGAKKEFQERWSTNENPLFELKKYKPRLYLAHGVLDKVVPIAHSDSLVSKLEFTQIEYNRVEQAEHDYRFWNSQVSEMLDFFENK